MGHSKNYAKIKSYYDDGQWNKEQVRSVVNIDNLPSPTTVSGYPITLVKSLGKPLVGYSISGASTQRLLPEGYT